MEHDAMTSGISSILVTLFGIINQKTIGSSCNWFDTKDLDKCLELVSVRGWRLVGACTACTLCGWIVSVPWFCRMLLLWLAQNQNCEQRSLSWLYSPFIHFPPVYGEIVYLESCLYLQSLFSHAWKTPFGMRIYRIMFTKMLRAPMIMWITVSCSSVS